MKFNYSHLIVAVVVFFIVLLITGGNAEASFIGVVLLYLGREQAQGEYDYIKANGGTRKSAGGNLRVLVGGFKHWNSDKWLDLIIPVATGFILLVFTTIVQH